MKHHNALGPRPQRAKPRIAFEGLKSRTLIQWPVPLDLVLFINCFVFLWPALLLLLVLLTPCPRVVVATVSSISTSNCAVECGLLVSGTFRTGGAFLLSVQLCGAAPHVLLEKARFVHATVGGGSPRLQRAWSAVRTPQFLLKFPPQVLPYAMLCHVCVQDLKSTHGDDSEVHPVQNNR